MVRTAQGDQFCSNSVRPSYACEKNYPLMTLNEIAVTIDAQIVRMQKIRAVVATLLPTETAPVAEPTFAALRSVEDSPDEIQDAPLASMVFVPSPRKPRPRRSRSLPSPSVRVRQTSPTALGGAVPQGPVVVSAATVRSRSIVEATPATPLSNPPARPGHSLDDLVRQLTGRSGMGLSESTNGDASR